MSAASKNNDDNQEIDLSQVSKKIAGFFENILSWIFSFILFLKRNAIIIGILFFLGVGIGIYLDKNNKVYDNQIIVSPNFSSVDYLYSKIDLINSKVNEGDSIFLKNVVGIKDTKNFTGIEIEPITDIYRFIGTNPVNFELVKLMAEDGEIQKIVDDKLTSKNYVFHNIYFSTSKPTSEEATVKPILAYLNNSDYYKKIQKEYINNVTVKMKENDSIITQIDGILNSFSNTITGSQKSSNLVYYNENTQLNEVIKTKNELIAEQGSHRMELVGLDEIIKENSSTINIKNNKSVNGKMKLVVPMFFLFVFFAVSVFILFYKRQSAKFNK
jgi:hypothetical protein